MNPLLLTLLLACQDGYDGTAVGNPGKLGLSAGDEGTDLTLSRAEADVDSVVVEPCDAPAEVMPVHARLDLLAAEHQDLPLPGGALCGFEIQFTGELPVSVEGSTAGGTAFVVLLDPGPLYFGTRVDVDGHLLLVDLPIAPALDAAELEARGDDVVVEADDPVAEAWAADAAESAALYEDADADGALTEDDAVLAIAGERPNPSAQAGCGCGATRGAGAAWLLAAALLLLRRGRR